MPNSRLSIDRARSFVDSKLAIESLEVRRCLAGDLELSQPTTLVRLANNDSEIGTYTLDEAPQATPEATVESTNRDNKIACPRDVWVDGIMSLIDDCHDLEPVSEEILNEDTFDEDGTEAIPDESEVQSTMLGIDADEPSPARELTAGDEWIASIFADAELGLRESQNGGVENPAAPWIEPKQPKPESRPVIQPVETLHVPINVSSPRGDSQKGVGGSTISPRPLAGPSPSVSVDCLQNPVKDEFFVVLHTGFSDVPANGRPSIASVAVLMPLSGPIAEPSKLTSQESLEMSVLPLVSKGEDTEAELLEEERLVKLVTYPDFGFDRETEKKEELAAGATEKSLNPLCFVVLVGIVGLPQSWRNRMLRSLALRDMRRTSRPITVVPLERQTEPWRKTTFVDRKQDETT